MTRRLAALSAFLADALACALVWSRLPERVAVHWGFHGEPNGWGSRTTAVLLGPGLIALLFLGLEVFLRVDPKRVAAGRDLEATPGERDGTLDLFIALAFTLLALLHGVLLLVGAGLLSDPPRAHALILASFLLVAGNFFGRLRPSWFVGIRTPWTLSSDEVWRRTHRLAGRLMVPSGLLGIPLALALPGARSFEVVTVLLLVSLCGPAVWSYFAWRSREA